MVFYNTKNTYSYKKMGDKTRKNHISFGRKMLDSMINFTPKVLDVASRMPNALRTYNDLSNQAEREGFKEQMSDMLGSKTLTNMIFNPFTSLIMKKYGKSNNNPHTNNEDWD
tara:strand:+ start:452 stop:787 length:336 start_codon:yes stop_codon:yes gene_type:complete